MKIKKNTLLTIQSQTALNDHCGAILTAAQALSCDNIVERIVCIIRERDQVGHLDLKLSELQHKCYKDLLVFAKEHLSDVDYRELYGAF